MANTYTQIYIHYVFATQKRWRFLAEEKQQPIYEYMAALVRNFKCYTQCIGGAEDHVHLLVGLHPTLSVSDFAQKLKANTSRFINEKGWAMGKFLWQDGFGAFSVSKSGLTAVREYISRQKEHHTKHKFLDEFEALLKRYEIDYDMKYVFHEPGE